MSPETSQHHLPSTLDLEKEPLAPISDEEKSAMEKTPQSVLNEDHLELRVGQDHASRSSGRGVRILSRAFRSIAILLVAFLAANGFWALFRPDLFDHHGLFALSSKDDHGKHGHGHRHHHHHHHGPEHPPRPPPHGPPSHDHPHPPPPPPHKPGHGPGGDHPGPPHGPPGHDHPHPPPPPPHKPGHGPGGDRPGPPGPPPPPGPPGHPQPPPPPPHKGPPKVRECFDLVPGETLSFETPLEWFGQGVEVAPSLAGSSVTFIWDGKVGPPSPPPHGPPHPPRPPHPPHDKDASEVDDEKSSKKPKKAPGKVIFDIDIPSKADWKEAQIESHELKICSIRRPGSTGIDIFNATGIPPNHAHIDPAFDQVAPRFNTTIRLPNHYARAPIRTGHLP